MSKFKTPRGSFDFRFDSVEEAAVAGFSIWFEHEGVFIVSDGRSAYAVAK